MSIYVLYCSYAIKFQTHNSPNPKNVCLIAPFCLVIYISICQKEPLTTIFRVTTLVLITKMHLFTHPHYFSQFQTLIATKFVKNEFPKPWYTPIAGSGNQTSNLNCKCLVILNRPSFLVEIPTRLSSNRTAPN